MYIKYYKIKNVINDLEIHENSDFHFQMPIINSCCKFLERISYKLKNSVKEFS